MKNKNITWIYLSILMGFALVITISCKKENNSYITPISIPPAIPDSVIDIDGNVYHTVRIGTQVWMVENLKTTRYNNGDSIPNITNLNEWYPLETGAWCYYNNYTENGSIYGKLYNWKAADNNNICPSGWHLPSKNEWNTLINYLGGQDSATNKLKEAGIAHWKFDTGATNKSGFTALPGGCFATGYNSSGAFYGIGLEGCWWSSTFWNDIIGAGGSGGWIILLKSNCTFIKEPHYNGYSVRCIFNWTY